MNADHPVPLSLALLSQAPCSRTAPARRVLPVFVAVIALAAALAGGSTAHAASPQAAGAAPASQTKPHPSGTTPAPTTQTPAQAKAAPAPTKAKEHQATGTVASSASAQLAILKQFGRNKAQWNFVVNAKTTFDAKPAKGARVRILYHEDKGLRVADRVKTLEAAPAASPTSKTSATKTTASTATAAKSSAAKPPPAPAPKSSPPTPNQ